VISAVKAAEQKKKRKRRVASPPAITTPTILMPRSQKVGSEDEEEEEEKGEAVEELPVPEDQAAGAGAEDVGGSSPTWFGGTAQCCGGAGEDTCGY
jgi:hypothetical protein